MNEALYLLWKQRKDYLKLLKSEKKILKKVFIKWKIKEAEIQYFIMKKKHNNIYDINS